MVPLHPSLRYSPPRESRDGRLRRRRGLHVSVLVTIPADQSLPQVSLGQSAKSIPLAAITGLIVGFVIGYLIFASGSRVNLSIFLVVSTSILLLIGAGLCSRGVWFFQQYRLVRG